jgi:hypothetical protein
MVRLAEGRSGSRGSTRFAGSGIVPDPKGCLRRQRRGPACPLHGDADGGAPQRHAPSLLRAAAGLGQEAEGDTGRVHAQTAGHP